MLAGGGANDTSMEFKANALDVPQRMGSVAVGQAAGYNLNPASSSGDELFSQAFITSHLSQGVDLICPIFFHCPIVAGDRSLRVDARYNVLAQLPTPAVTVIAWRTNASLCLLTSETNEGVSTGLTLTRCVQSKRIQLSVTPPLEITSRLLSLKVGIVILNSLLLKLYIVTLLIHILHSSMNPLIRSLQENRLFSKWPSQIARLGQLMLKILFSIL